MYYAIQLQPGVIRPRRIERPKICQMDLAGFTKGNRSTRTEFHNALPTTNSSNSTTTNVRKDTNASLAVSLCAGAGASLDSNVSVVKKGETAWSIAVEIAPPNILYSIITG